MNKNMNVFYFYLIINCIVYFEKGQVLKNQMRVTSKKKKRTNKIDHFLTILKQQNLQYFQLKATMETYYLFLFT